MPAREPGRGRNLSGGAVDHHRRGRGSKSPKKGKVKVKRGSNSGGSSAASAGSSPLVAAKDAVMEDA
ncbi:Histone deacetylase superfamily [Penicillium cf. griseofulvum]|nr:Histone deacetylase superfamily [Penicillium cf. griseofulvum]